MKRIYLHQVKEGNKILLSENPFEKPIHVMEVQPREKGMIQIVTVEGVHLHLPGTSMVRASN